MTLPASQWLGDPLSGGGDTKMTEMFLNLYVKAQILSEDSGQDLIEYALVAALIAFAAVAGMNGIAGKINDGFSMIGSRLTSAMS
jgi:pilus assembly protein Flp/PilA